MQKQDKKDEVQEELENGIQNLPKYKAAKLKKQWNQIRIYEEQDAVLIKPTYDASNQEIFANNAYRSQADQLIYLLENLGNDESKANVFRPLAIGEFSNNYYGTIKTTIEQNVGRKPDYALSYIMNNRREEAVRKSQEELLAAQLAITDVIQEGSRVIRLPVKKKKPEIYDENNMLGQI